MVTLFLTADDIEPWMIWGYYLSPMMYGQNAIVMNEFLDKRWNSVRSLIFYFFFHFLQFVTYI